MPTARDEMRTRNQNAVLQTVHLHGPISRVEIATKLALSPAAVTIITGDLITRGLIYEARRAESDGVGRKAILLEVDYDHAAVAGIKVSDTAVTAALTNLNAEVAYTETRPLPATDPDTVVDEIERAFRALQTQADQPLRALGVNLPGIVDLDQSTVRHSPLLDWDRVPLGAILAQRLEVPVLVENDVNALALAEAWYGHGREHDSFLVLTLGRGVGLGIVLNGELYRGPSGGAGEFGHVLLDAEGPTTEQAARGTIESFLSDAALLRRARERIDDFPDGDGPRDLLALAEAGDERALAAYREAGTVLGRALSMLTNILAPDLVVLSGEGMRASQHIVPPARRELERLAFGDLGARVRLVVDHWGDDAWARGAAGLAASRYLTDAVSTPGGDTTGSTEAHPVRTASPTRRNRT